MSEDFSSKRPGTTESSIELLEEGEVSLNFLQQEPLVNYSDLIHKAEAVSFDDAREMRANYDHVWETYQIPLLGTTIPEVVSTFAESLDGAILCDLGSDGRMDLSAAINKASLFISVNKYPGGVKSDLIDNPKVGDLRMVEFKDKLTGTVLVPGVLRHIYVRADLLNFVSRLTDCSVNITINGIDSDLIYVEGYHEAVAQEIMRVTKPGGVIFGNSSVALYIIRDLIKSNPEIGERFKLIYANGGVVVIKRI